MAPPAPRECFKHKKAMRMSDPKHFDHILPFLRPADVHHAIPLTAQEVLRMHAKDDVPVAAGASELEPDRISRSLPAMLLVCLVRQAK